MEYIIKYFSETFQSFMAYLNYLAGGDGTITAALLLTCTTVAGLLLFVLKKASILLWKFILKQITIELTVGTGDWNQREAYYILSEALHDKAEQGKIRTFKTVTRYCRNLKDEILVMVLGNGVHRIKINGKNFFVFMGQETTGNTKTETMTLKIFSFSNKPLKELIEAIQPKSDSELVSIYKYSESDKWSIDNKIYAPNLSDMALDPKIENQIRTMMDDYLSGEARCRELAIAWKLTVILHGSPGTGKTALIRAIAKEYNLGLCILSTSASSLTGAVNTVRKGNILLMEDFDSFGGLSKRKNVTDVKDKLRENNVSQETSTEIKEEEPQEEDALTKLFGSEFSKSSLSEFLNALDGIVPLDGVPFFLTTNDIESFDLAVVRKGRIDNIIELPLLSPETVKNHLEKHFPKLREDYPNYKYIQLAGCHLYDIKRYSLHDHHKVIEKLDDLKTELFVTDHSIEPFKELEKIQA